VTDTVGFISELPHWLVESFKSTLDSVYLADLVLLVVDVSESIETIREKLVTSHDTLYERNEAPIVTVLNKADLVEDEEITRKREALSALAPNPVVVSAHTGENVDTLRGRIHDELPELERERLVMPMTDDTMSVVSWIHDNAVDPRQRLRRNRRVRRQRRDRVRSPAGDRRAVPGQGQQHRRNRGLSVAATPRAVSATAPASPRESYRAGRSRPVRSRSLRRRRHPPVR